MPVTLALEHLKKTCRKMKARAYCAVFNWRNYNINCLFTLRFSGGFSFMLRAMFLWSRVIRSICWKES